MTNFEKTILYFQASAEKDLEIADKLFNDKECSYSLFFCHLAIEKILKAAIV